MLRFVVSFTLLFLFANTGYADELAYQWIKGSTHRFQTKSVDDITISGMGVDMNMQFTLNSIFGIQVDSVNTNGTASGVVFVEEFTVTNKAGKTIATIDDIPPKALTNPVQIDTKGNFTFTEVLQLVVDDKGNSMLVSAKIDKNGGSASAQVGGEKVTLRAKFDPKTGELDAGYSVEKIEKPTETVKVKEDASAIDVLPTQFLEMLKLPEGDIVAGQDFSMSVANMTITTKTSNFNGGMVDLHTSLKTGDGKGTSSGSAGDGIGEMANMGGMGDMMGMGDMSGMGMGDIAGMENTPDMALNGAFDSTFNMKEGSLQKIDGFISSEMSMNGMMSIKTKTTLELNGL